MKMMVERIKSLSPRAWPIVGCVALILLRMFFPSLVFDQTSFWLLLVVVLLLLVPNIGELPERIAKITKGDLEIEFDKKIDELKQQTEEVEHRAEANSGLDLVGIPEEVKGRILNSLAEPRAALISLAVEIESRLRDLAEKHNVTHRGYFAPRTTIQELASRKVLSATIEPIFNDFWAIRNNAVHARGFVPNQSRLFELVDLGLRVLRFLYAVPRDRYDLLTAESISCPKCGKDVRVNYKSARDSESADATCGNCGWSGSVSNRL